MEPSVFGLTRNLRLRSRTLVLFFHSPNLLSTTTLLISCDFSSLKFFFFFWVSEVFEPTYTYLNKFLFRSGQRYPIQDQQTHKILLFCSLIPRIESWLIVCEEQTHRSTGLTLRANPFHLIFFILANHRLQVLHIMLKSLMHDHPTQNPIWDI